MITQGQEELGTNGLFLKISPLDFARASRDQRELSVMRDLGMATLVMTKGQRRGTTITHGWTVLELSTRPLGVSSLLVNLNRLTSLATWALEARRLRPSIISGHDLLGLFIAWLSTWFVPRGRRPLLVYDSQEFELGRNTGGRRGPWTSRRVQHLESFLMRRCVFSIMVNDAIAERVQKIHGLAEKPVVVRNIPPFWAIDEQKCGERRADFCRALGVPLDTFLLMYHGGVGPNRGIEVSIRALVGRESVALVVLGNGDREYLGRLRGFTQELGVRDRVVFFDAVPLEVLGEYVGAADAGMVIVPAVTESYYLMLPNKFFENVQALTPVIASDFPEIGALVRKYDIGVLVDPEDVPQVGDAIDRLQSDPAVRSRLRANLKTAKGDLCWENEKKRLEVAYSRILREPCD